MSGPPPMPSVTVPDARNWNWNEAKQYAKHHAKSERDVAEFRGCLYRVAEIFPDFFSPVGRHQHAHAITELEHQVRRRHEVGVISPDVQKVGLKPGGHRKT